MIEPVAWAAAPAAGAGLVIYIVRRFARDYFEVLPLKVDHLEDKVARVEVKIDGMEKAISSISESLDEIRKDVSVLVGYLKARNGF